MPLTAKGQEILASMKKQYGDKRGEEVFYASKNAGKITGVDSEATARMTALDHIAAACDSYESTRCSPQAHEHSGKT
jgi:hypothetical protein